MAKVTGLPGSYRKVARRASCKVTLGDPGDLRSSLTVAEQLFREPIFGPNSANSGRCWSCSGQVCPDAGNV